jgi:hypothetical protein
MSVMGGRNPQCDDAAPHTGAATSAAIESNKFEVVPHLPCSLDLPPSDFGCLQLSRHISKEFLSHVMKKWFQEQPEEFCTDGFEKLVQH